MRANEFQHDIMISYINLFDIKIFHDQYVEQKYQI